jgi:hypothetical protein
LVTKRKQAFVASGESYDFVRKNRADDDDLIMFKKPARLTLTGTSMANRPPLSSFISPAEMVAIYFKARLRAYSTRD